ncbi:hypothetical protein LCGC14_0382840 [marine sediment metagenome]|uniref:Uncharacterized protein n=1 Tax=marine sediment metagenome TaxID=412755 RepID=A0A0F9T1W5_9ZZZZ
MSEKKPPKVTRTEFRACGGCGDLLAAGESCPNCKK